MPHMVDMLGAHLHLRLARSHTLRTSRFRIRSKRL